MEWLYDSRIFLWGTLAVQPVFTVISGVWLEKKPQYTGGGIY